MSGEAKKTIKNQMPNNPLTQLYFRNLYVYEIYKILEAKCLHQTVCMNVTQTGAEQVAERCALGEKTRMNEPAHQDANHEVCSVKKKLDEVRFIFGLSTNMNDVQEACMASFDSTVQ